MMYEGARRKAYCKNCGQAFYAYRKDAQFDSARCRAEYSRQMKKLRIGYACPGLHKAYRKSFEWLCDNAPEAARLIAGARAHHKSIRLAELMIAASLAAIASVKDESEIGSGTMYSDLLPEYLKPREDGGL